MAWWWNVAGRQYFCDTATLLSHISSPQPHRIELSFLKEIDLTMSAATAAVQATKSKTVLLENQSFQMDKLEVRVLIF